jgi:excisionase family DNA binding protein
MCEPSRSQHALAIDSAYVAHRERRLLGAIDDVLLVTPEEAARRLSLGRTTVYSLIASGVLESIRIGRLRRVPVAALGRYVERGGVRQDPDTASPSSE